MYLLSLLRQTSNLLHHNDTPMKINTSIKMDKCELPTFYWLPKLNKNPDKPRFI